MVLTPRINKPKRHKVTVRGPRYTKNVPKPINLLRYYPSFIWT